MVDLYLGILKQMGAKTKPEVTGVFYQTMYHNEIPVPSSFPASTHG
jgi:hypothetical protein